jgi:hypothetical protein
MALNVYIFGQNSNNTTPETPGCMYKSIFDKRKTFSSRSLLFRAIFKSLNTREIISQALGSLYGSTSQ